MGITAHVLIPAGAAIDHTPLLCGATPYDATLKAARLSPFFQTIDRTEAPSPEALVIHTKRPVGL